MRGNLRALPSEGRHSGEGRRFPPGVSPRHPQLDIPYGRSKGVTFTTPAICRHEPRRRAAAEAVAMTITGHVDPSVFKRYDVRRDDVQADALARQGSYLATKRGTTPSVLAITRKADVQGTAGHDGPAGFLGHRVPTNCTIARASIPGLGADLGVSSPCRPSRECRRR
jgi:hypothetical protein